MIDEPLQELDGYWVRPEIVRTDKDYWIGRQHDYKDDGPVTEGAKTRRFIIYLRGKRTLLGHIKWYNHARAYALSPLNSVFSVESLLEISQFCQEATRVHKDRIKLKKNE